MEQFVTKVDFVCAVRYTGHNRDELPAPPEGGWLSEAWKAGAPLSYYWDSMGCEMRVFVRDWVLADDDTKRAFCVLQHEQFLKLFGEIDAE